MNSRNSLCLVLRECAREDTSLSISQHFWLINEMKWNWWFSACEIVNAPFLSRDYEVPWRCFSSRQETVSQWDTKYVSLSLSPSLSLSSSMSLLLFQSQSQSVFSLVSVSSSDCLLTFSLPLSISLSSSLCLCLCPSVCPSVFLFGKRMFFAGTSYFFVIL